MRLRSRRPGDDERPGRIELDAALEGQPALGDGSDSAEAIPSPMLPPSRSISPRRPRRRALGGRRPRRDRRAQRRPGPAARAAPRGPRPHPRRPGREHARLGPTAGASWSPRQGTIKVLDQGPGLAADEATAVFERLPPAAARAARAAGTACGCRSPQLSRRWGGDVRLENGEHGGARAVRSRCPSAGLTSAWLRSFSCVPRSSGASPRWPASSSPPGDARRQLAVEPSVGLSAAADGRRQPGADA